MRMLSSDRIVQMYYRLYVRAQMFLMFMWNRNVIVQIMGEEVINPAAEEEIYVDPKNPDKRTSQPWRILKLQGEPWVFGEAMRPGQGKQDEKKNTHDPLVCQHPSDKMYARGGKNDLKWWTCAACNSRWERIPLSSYSLVTMGKPPTGRDVLTFGKHTGETYDTVWKTDPSYCQWVMQTVSRETRRAPTSRGSLGT